MPSLRAWPHVKRLIFAPDVLVVEPRFGTSVYERFVDVWAHIEIAIDRAVAEFDFKNVQPFAVADRGERGRFNGHALEMRDDWFAANCGGREKKDGECNGGNRTAVLYRAALNAVEIYFPSGFVTSVPAGGVNSKVEAGMAPRVSFEYVVTMRSPFGCTISVRTTCKSLFILIVKV